MRYHLPSTRGSLRGALALGLAALLGAPALALGQDSDGDGAADAADVYPCDAARAGVSFFPGEGSSALLAFEDQWPGPTDVDFNDVVVRAHYRLERDAAGNVVQLVAVFDPVALGGDFSNGLGLALPVSRAGVSVRRRAGEGAWEAVALEADANATMVLSPNLRELFGGADGRINARAGEARRSGQRLEVEVTFATPAPLAVASAPFDVFVFRAGNLSHQIHFPQYAGTAAMDGALFNTGHDGSTATRRFVHFSGVPAALNLMTSTRYPLEGVGIASLFPDIALFAASAGAQGAGFYEGNVVAAQGHDVAALALPAVAAADRACIRTVGRSSDRPAANCAEVLDQNPALAGQDGLYWLDAGAGAFQAFCDMTTGGGGWTLVMQASSSSAYVYSHAVWTASSAPLTAVPQPSIDQDQVSPAFYAVAGTESMLCLGDRARCAAWSHPSGTARELVNGPRMSATQASGGVCDTLFCGASTRPAALSGATPGSSAGAWLRFGYVNDQNGWGTRTRVGFTGDNDGSDSSDTTMGIGLECTSNCRSFSTTDGAHDRGAGYYKYNGWSVAPHDGALRAFLFVRSVPPAKPLNAESSAHRDCEAIRVAGEARGDGVYWIRPDGVNASKAYCDMTTAGGGWTMVMQASSISAYTYGHEVWTRAAAPQGAYTDPGLDMDQVSPAFYALSATESMLCMGSLSQCASWTHAQGTARDLANGSRMAGTQGQNVFCGGLACDSTTLPNALVRATPGTTAAAWHRFGYVNDVNPWGTRTRVGATADNDSSDSSDTVIGLGIECFNQCSGNSTSDGAHGRGAGYYKYHSWSTAPHDGSLRGFLFVRSFTPPLARNASADAPASCRAIRDAGASQGDGVYWIRPDGVNPTMAHCDMTTDGGGWTLVMQTASASSFGYFHPVWTQSSVPGTLWTDAAVDADQVSPAFYALSASESMLCMGSAGRCAAWTHASGTPRNLATGARMASTQGASGFCSSFRCASNTVPNALVGATPGTTAAAWHRFGYVNDNVGWGTRTRVGTTADNDSSDSADTTIGMGLDCFSNCRGDAVTGVAHDTGSGYYKYRSWSVAPHDGALRGWLYTR